MRCAAIGQRYVWFFNAPNKTEGKKIANTILFFEKIGAGKTLSGINPSKHYYWEAVAVELTDEIEAQINGVDESKIVRIKRKRPPVIDVIYMTRLQKERQPAKTT